MRCQYCSCVASQDWYQRVRWIAVPNTAVVLPLRTGIREYAGLWCPILQLCCLSGLVSESTLDCGAQYSSCVASLDWYQRVRWIAVPNTAVVLPLRTGIREYAGLWCPILQLCCLSGLVSESTLDCGAQYSSCVASLDWYQRVRWIAVPILQLCCLSGLVSESTLDYSAQYCSCVAFQNWYQRVRWIEVPNTAAVLPFSGLVSESTLD